jgi:hypothetical protein
MQLCGLEEPLEIPVLNDIAMVLGSIAQVINCFGLAFLSILFYKLWKNNRETMCNTIRQLFLLIVC